ncbi:SDR family NAD(P)-dependent oxidoreductase [Kineococcus sp. SYSU DK005]|uniref:SDR family NAD(P)-dependent oxidoreductase n=1 Tax=Kineococcus sp. SYSU DK005 TaxID=3383126 RepID=UPI003D7D0D95
MTDLDGARVLLTGAGGGLGRPIAARLAAAGARLVVSGRDRARLEGLPGHPVTADLRLPDGPGALVDAAVAHLGGLDGLVHAAGVVAFGPLEEADDDLLDELFLADALGPVRLLRAAVPHLRSAARERPGAFVAVVSAVVAEQPVAGMAAYSAAKAALSAFAGAAGKELRREGVRVLDVRPPHTETGLAGRPVAGTAPRLPAGLDPDAVAERVVRAIVDDERDLPARAFG